MDKKYSTYNNINKKNILFRTKNKRFIIFAHCFFDNPHVYGRNFFYDFYDWINYFGLKKVKKLKY